MKRKIVSWIMIIAILLNYSHINIFSTVFAEEKSISKTEEKVTKDNNKILGLELSDSNFELCLGEEHKLEYKIITEDNYKEDIVWSCDDENIATVNDGIIKGINPGKATITAKTIDEEFIKFCEVSVVGETSNTFSNGDYYEFTLEKNKNYEIINKSDKQINISVDYSKKYDSITYDNNGNIYSYYKNDYGNIYINKQYKLKVGIKENDIKINIPNSDKDFIEIKEVEEPLLYEGVLNNETTYELTSSGDKSLSLKQIDSTTIRYDYINYNSDGSIYSFYKNDYGTISTNNNKKKIRIKDKDYNYYIPYERKEELKIVESQEELIYDGVLKSNTTYEIVNTGQSISLLKAESGTIYYDYIIYKNDGSINNFYKNYSSAINTNANKRKVRIKDKDYNYYIPYEIKDELKIVESQEELIYDGVLKSNTTYEIINTGQSISLSKTESGTIYYDYIIYNNDGSINNFYKNYSSSINTNANKRKVRIKDKDYNYYIPYEIKDELKIVESQEELIYDGVLKSNTTYEIINTGQSISLSKTESGTIYYDYIIYNNDGSINNFYKNYSSSINTNANKRKVRIKDKDYNYYIPYEIKDKVSIIPSDDLLLYEFTTYTGKNYLIENKSDKNIKIDNKESHKFDGVVYNQDKSINRFYTDGTSSGGIDFLKYESRKLSINENNKEDITWFMPYEQKDSLEVNEIQEPALYKFTTAIGKSYKIENKSDEKILVDSKQSCKFDGVVYNQDKSINRFYTDGTSSGGIDFLKYESRKLSINENNKEDIVWFIPYEQKDKLDIKEIDEPALHKFKMDENKSYKIYNNSDKNVVLKNNNYNFKYDYILYKADSSYKYMTNQYGDITLKTNEHIVIAKNQNNNENAVWYIPYEYCNNEIVIKESASSIGELFDLQPKIKVDIRKVLSKNETDQNDNIVEDTLSNYYISVKNKTQNKNINDIQIKGKYILLQNNDVKSGDEISINFRSKKNDTLEKAVDVKLDENMQGNMHVDITQLGYVNINHNNTDNITIRTMIFDKDGKSVQNISTSDNKNINSKYLNDGKYTVLMLKSNGNLWRLNSLQEFDARYLVEGIDYTKNDIEIKEGKITNLQVDDIPILDEDRISFLDRKNTKVTTSSENIAENATLDIRIQYKFKDEYNKTDISNKKISVTLPKEVLFIDNSVILDNKKTEYEYVSDKLTIPVDSSEGVIKFSTRPVESKKVEIIPEVNFRYNSKSYSEVIGIATLDINYLTLNGPKEVNEKRLKVFGISQPNTIVEIYDENSKLGEVKSQSNGKWVCEIELKNAYSQSIHKLRAKQSDRLSNELELRYSEEAPSISKFIMIHNNKSYDLTKSLLEGDRPSITIVPRKSFTFKIEVDNGEEIEELYVTSIRNNEEKRIKAIYNNESQAWVASGFFGDDKNYTPGTLNIVYKVKEKEYNFNNKIDFTKDEYINSLPNEWKNVNIETIKNEIRYKEFILSILNNSKEINFRVILKSEDIPEDINIENIESLGFMKVNNDMYINPTKDKYTLDVISYDLHNRFGESIKIEVINGSINSQDISEYFNLEENKIVFLDRYIDIINEIETIMQNSLYTQQEKEDKVKELNQLKIYSDAFNITKTIYTVLNPYLNNNLLSNDIISSEYVMIFNESRDGTKAQPTGKFSVEDKEESKILNQEKYSSDDIDVDYEKIKDIKDKNISLYKEYEEGDKRIFHINHNRDGNYVEIKAKLRYKGKNICVWTPDWSSLSIISESKKLGKKFDEDIYGLITTYFGKEDDMDGNKRIDLFYYPFEGVSAEISYGYFGSMDLFNEDEIKEINKINEDYNKDKAEDEKLPLYKTNLGEIIYVDSKKASGNQLMLEGIIAHEFQHLINASIRKKNGYVIIEPGMKFMESWLDEALSELATEIYMNEIYGISMNEIYEEEGVINRIKEYNNDTNGHIRNGRSLLHFNGKESYSLSYLFIEYLRIQCNQLNGYSDIYKRLINSKDIYQELENIANTYLKKEDVNSFIDKYINPSEKNKYIKEDGKITFEAIMLMFRIALFNNNPNEDLEGFKGISKFNKLNRYTYNGGQSSLVGGGAITIKLDVGQQLKVPEIGSENGQRGENIQYIPIGSKALGDDIVNQVGQGTGSLISGVSKPGEQHGSSNGSLPNWLIDPSGYVYEAVDSNRVEGVTTTVYYKDENGQAVKWNAEEYDQMNPLITDKEGKYAWDVPEGLWQVKYEKEGYETTYSEWLPVPPPQTEVNIGIVSYEKPKIEMFNMYEDGAEITFNKYMDISTINTNSVLLSNFKGDNIQFTIEPMNEEETKEGKLVASKFKLKANIKNLLTLDNTYTLTVKTTAKTYAGISENNDIVESTIYKQLPTVINVEDNYNIGYNQTIKIPVSIDNISNAEEFVLNAKSGMDDIVTILNNKVNFNKNGKAYIEVKGMLPGETTITFDIEGLDLTKEVTINVNMDNNEENPNNPPIIEAKDVELTVGDEFNPRNGVTAYDLEDEDLTSRIIVKENTVNTKVKGTYKVVYEVTDNDGNTTTKEIKVTVKESELPKIELTDIKGHWAQSQIINFVSNGYVGGYPDGTFRPDNSITRAEFVKIFNKYFGLTKTSGKVFNDTTTHWAKSEIDIAVTNGVANGVSATEFKPDEPITREQAAVMICNYKKLSDKNHDKINKYSDKGNVSSWAKDSVEGVIEKGYMNGYSDNTFRPKNNITRAEAVVTLSRIIK